MNDETATTTRLRRARKKRKRFIWDCLGCIITFWSWRKFFEDLLEGIRRIFTFTAAFLWHPMKLVYTERCCSLNSDSNRSSEIEHFEENTAVKERVSGELKMTEGNVQVNRCDMEENIAKSVVVVCPEQMVSKYPEDSLHDFIFDDNYFEDSWNLHSNLLLGSYFHQINILTPLPSKIATVCDNNSEVARHSFHMSKIAQFHSQPSLNLPWTKDSPNDHATCELRRDPNVKKYYIRDLNEDLKRLKMDENGKNLRTIEDIDENSTSAARINHVWNTSHGVEDKTEENCNPLEELSILDQIDQNMNDFSFSNSFFENNHADVSITA